MGSLTKTMTAVTVLRLVDEGRLSLDDHLSQYVGGIPNGARITIRELLGMRAGVYDRTANARMMDRWWSALGMPGPFRRGYTALPDGRLRDTTAMYTRPSTGTTIVVTGNNGAEAVFAALVRLLGA